MSEPTTYGPFELKWQNDQPYSNPVDLSRHGRTWIVVPDDFAGATITVRAKIGPTWYDVDGVSLDVVKNKLVALPAGLPRFGDVIFVSDENETCTGSVIGVSNV